MDVMTSNIVDLVAHGFHTVDDGCKIYYELHGNGTEKIVLLQGFHTSLLTWKNQVEHFVADKHRRYQVLLVDNRGYGRSDAPKGFYTTSRMAADVYSLLKDGLKWSHYHLVGQSMGGMIAQELALLDFRSLLSLCLCVTHAGGKSSLPPLEGMAKSLVTVLASLSSPAAHATSILRIQYPEVWLNSMRAGSNETNLDYMVRVLVEDLKWANSRDRPMMVGIAGQLGAIARHYVAANKLRGLRKKLAAQGTPLLLVSGSEDLLVRLTNSDSLQETFACPHKKIDNTGHMLHYQEPREFNAVLQNHFDSAAISPSTPCLVAKL